MSSDDRLTASQTEEFPVATVRERPSPRSILVSKMWWVTLACVVLAGVLAWRSLPKAGPVITISFPRGHGLKSGDALRHRGIDVGVVQSASLTSDLGGIEVAVQLNPEAEILCREQSRFWIVRPRVGLTGIEGLETVIGARYIAVSPGPSDAPEQRQFEGLSAAPPDEFAGEGLELILRSESRGGLNPGAPVTWRGVQAGQVLSVGLSPDARHVHASIRINGSHRRLVTSGSKFWISSGIGVHVGLSGIDLNAESLASLALGGVSFITPSTAEPTTDISSGHVFTLHPEVNSEWLENPPAIPLIDIELPETVSVTGSVESSLLGIRRDKPFSSLGLILRQQDDSVLLTAGLPVQSTEAADQIPELQIRTADGTGTVTVAATAAPAETALNVIPLAADGSAALKGRPYSLRHAADPEDCCIARTEIGEGTPAPMIHALSREELTARQDQWVVTDRNDTDLSEWSGAPVMSLTDGCVIGVLMVTEQGTAVVTIPPELQQ